MAKKLVENTEWRDGLIQKLLPKLRETRQEIEADVETEAARAADA